MRHYSFQRRSLLSALILAVLSGFVLDMAFPDQGFWPLIFVGLLLAFEAVRYRSFWGGCFVGFLTGLSFYLFHLSWATLYLGPVPYLALSILESLFWAGAGGLFALAYKWAPAIWSKQQVQIFLPVLLASLWVFREFVTNSWPYKGFSWGRVALSQSESLLTPLVSWVGISGLSFIIVLFSAWVHIRWLFFCADFNNIFAPRNRKVFGAIHLFSLPVVVVCVLFLIPNWTPTTQSTMRVAAVQGNGPAGYFDDASPGEVFDSQVQATSMMKKVPTDLDVDLVVWPEGSAPGLLTNKYVANSLTELAQTFNAPFLVGTILEDSGEIFNASILWDVEGNVAARYDKKRPVPFGEYVPDRNFWRMFAPDLIDLIGRDYAVGTRSNVIDIEGIKAGVFICFDVIDDSLLQEMIWSDAQIIFAQTNNADFGQTDENEQQLAIARLQAVASGRSVVNISTVGTSDVIDPFGKTLASIPPFEPGYMIADVPVATGVSPALYVGNSFEYFSVLLTIAMGIFFGISLRRPMKYSVYESIVIG